MLEIDKKNRIHITRGDSGRIKVSAINKDGSKYVFQVGDVVRLGVYEANNYENKKLIKDVEVEEEGKESVTIELSNEDTRIPSEIINEPVEYWYEIQLNPEENTQTIIGYDTKGPKIFKVYPEGKDEEEEEEVVEENNNENEGGE